MNILPVGTVLRARDEFKRKRNKVWRVVPNTMVGKPVTKRHAKLGFEFRRIEIW